MKHKLLILFLLSIFSLAQLEVSGQESTARTAATQSFCGSTGGFNVMPAEGCAPLTVNVKNLVPKPESLTYAFRFDRNQNTPPNTSETTQDSTFTYQIPGTYTILQYGSANGTGFSQCKDVVVKETRGPNAEIIACQNGKVRLTIASDDISKAYDAIEINWGDGAKQSVNIKTSTTAYFDHTYAGARPAITLRGTYTNGQCSTSTNTTTLDANTPPPSLEAIRILNVSMPASGDAKVIYEGIEGVETKLYIAKGDGDLTFTNKSGQTGGTQSASVPLLDPKVVYRFQLWSTDICGNIIKSPIVSSMTIKQGGLSLDEIIALEWENEPNTAGLVEYQLKRNGAVIFTTADKRSFEDTDVKCGNTYQYEIVAIVENDVRSYSAPISLDPKTSAPADINNAVVTVKDENTIGTKVELSGEGLTSSYNLIVERALLGSTSFEIVSPANNQSLQWDDANVSTSRNSYCYRFQYENACKLKSPSFSAPVCSILLTTNTPNIVWNPDAPFINPVESYDLQQVDEPGNLINVIPKGLSTSHTLDLASQSDFGYRIEAKSPGGNFTSLSNVLNFRSEAILLIPDAFTPNGDSYNERFEVKAYFVKDFSMSVFSRWGEVIFHSTDIAEGWDGNVKTGKAPGGYYLYKIEATNSSGQTVVKNGSFLLIR
ncbi:gliding motility-associated C-terminal domain-containing protein [Dyadobacter sp. CY261]|uniref:T9SS type B sorting domain-containing protein n=1 Tax=Dyadobacter sp. CY261 TaxID=2907203 RepID=UPI001F424E97|nr:gliding motility-associated C-terminal domain-containing protein [Dyadobacter sp. CY261]MCF0072504.1 gliding motility-associated C-terminal domain-containing protein [Dyadobacter sp. CY261]